MKSRTDLTLSELYALERSARLARAQEIARLLREFGKTLVRLAGQVVPAPQGKKEISHA